MIFAALTYQYRLGSSREIHLRGHSLCAAVYYNQRRDDKEKTCKVIK
jgi:hypothetical protein